MSVNIKVTGGLNIEWGQIDPKASGGLMSVDNTSTLQPQMDDIGYLNHAAVSGE